MYELFSLLLLHCEGYYKSLLLCLYLLSLFLFTFSFHCVFSLLSLFHSLPFCSSYSQPLPISFPFIPFSALCILSLFLSFSFLFILLFFSFSLSHSFPLSPNFHWYAFLLFSLSLFSLLIIISMVSAHVCKLRMVNVLHRLHTVIVARTIGPALTCSHE